jgi:hypothetical protein
MILLIKTTFRQESSVDDEAICGLAHRQPFLVSLTFSFTHLFLRFTHLFLRNGTGVPRVTRRMRVPDR